MYTFTNPPEGVHPWVVEQIRQLAEAQQAPVDVRYYRPLTAAPARIKDGMEVYAKSPWNPGSGDGLYSREGGVWKKL